MQNLAVVGGERSANGSLRDLATFLENPAIHDVPAAYVENAVVVTQLRWDRGSGMSRKVLRRRTDDASAGNQNPRYDIGVAWQVDVQSHIQLIAQNVELGIVQQKLDLNIGILFREVGDQWRDALAAD